MRRADEQFRMIEEGDRIAVGVSGGKDSLLLLYAMSLYRKFCKNAFEVEGIMLGMDAPMERVHAIAAFADKIDMPFTFLPTDIKEVVFDIRKEENPCALCANLRRGALNNLAKSHGCTKVALGHHREDVLETMLLSLFYEARLHVFAPVTYLERVDLTIIRPMVFLDEKHIVAMAHKLKLPVMINPCPANGHTKRQDMKELIESFKAIKPDAPKRMINAIANVEQYGLWDEASICRKPKKLP